MTDTFERVFRTTEPVRDAYLARLFAFFSEQLVRAWCGHPEAPYDDLGRPTLREPGQARGHTLDFTLRHRDTGRTYVAEAKCELAYEGYRYLRLTSADQLRHHTGAAFNAFLQAASDPAAYEIRVKGRTRPVDGAILIWGAITPEGRDATMSARAFADILSVEAMLADVHRWAPSGWSDVVARHRAWTNELFDFMAGDPTPRLNER